METKRDTQKGTDNVRERTSSKSEQCHFCDVFSNWYNSCIPVWLYTTIVVYTMCKCFSFYGRGYINQYLLSLRKRLTTMWEEECYPALQPGGQYYTHHTHVDSGALVLVLNAHSVPASCDPGACANSCLIPLPKTEPLKQAVSYYFSTSHQQPASILLTT